MQDWGSASSTSQQLQDMGLTRAEAENLVNSQRPEREYSIQKMEKCYQCLTKPMLRN